MNQPSIQAHSNMLSKTHTAANNSIHIQNPGRRGDSSPLHGQPPTMKNTQVRPPSRHKDPNKNLGLDTFPVQSGSRMGGGMTPHQVMFGNSIGSSAGDVEQDFDGDCEG